MTESTLNKLNRSPLHLSPWNVVLALAMCMGLQMTGFLIIMPLFAHLLDDFGAGIEALGLSTMAYALTSTLAAPFMGALADRIGKRPLVLASLVVYVLAFTGYWLADSAEAFILLRGLTGALTAGLTPAVMSIIGDIAPSDRRAQAVGIVNGGASIGWIIGPNIGGLLYDRWGYEIPFTLAVVVALITLVLALLVIPGTEANNRKRPQADLAPEKTSSRDPKTATPNTGLSHLPLPLTTFGVLLAISFVVVFAYAFIEPQLMFYAYDELGWTTAQLGLSMSIFGAAAMFGEFTLGRLSDRWGRKPVLLLGLALFSAQFLGLAMSDQFLWIVASFILAGLGNALFDPALSAYFLDLAPQAHRSRVMGMKSTAASLGNMTGPALVVLLAPYLLAQQIFAISMLLVLFITLLSGLSLRGQAHPFAQRLPAHPANVWSDGH